MSRRRNRILSQLWQLELRRCVDCLTKYRADQWKPRGDASHPEEVQSTCSVAPLRKLAPVGHLALLRNEPKYHVAAWCGWRRRLRLACRLPLGAATGGSTGAGADSWSRCGWDCVLGWLDGRATQGDRREDGRDISVPEGSLGPVSCTLLRAQTDLKSRGRG